MVDGDTVWLRGKKIRLAGIDGPEISEPRCVAELRLGLAARDRLQAILNANAWQVNRSGIDRYGRTLAVFRISGNTAGRSWCGLGLRADGNGVERVGVYRRDIMNLRRAVGALILSIVGAAEGVFPGWSEIFIDQPRISPNAQHIIFAIYVTGSILLLFGGTTVTAE